MTPLLQRLCAAMLLAGLSAASLGATPEKTTKKAAPAARTYIVQLRDAPVASYTGNVAGLQATQVGEGQYLDVRASAVQAYRAHLAREQDKLLASLGSRVKPSHRYSISFNGFAARLTLAQVQRLKASGKVRQVTLDSVRVADTVSTPAFLGLDGAAGFWSHQRKGVQLQGEDIVIATIDSGVQPENPAFYDHVDANGVPVATGGTLAYGAPPAHWLGGCTVAPAFPASACNHKLVGARVFNTGWLASGNLPWFGTYSDSPRDENGHGSHTLSTAGGNALAPAYDNAGLFLGSTSGVAPRARLASYKALFTTTTSVGLQAVGMTSDIVAAIEAAVADGADIINFSVSGNPGDMLDPVELAFLEASSANVFVAAAAGNSGMPGTIGHPAPWLTTVGASTHDRNPYAQLTLGNGVAYSGASFNAAALPAAPLRLAQDMAAAGISSDQANWCAPNSLDPSKAAGKLVVCDRGGIVTRLDKSAEVKRAGGIGMVLLNTDGSELDADWHTVPTVHLAVADRDAVRAYAANSSATGGIGARYQVPGVVAPVMAYFSSLGPNVASTNVMKPDLTAPGVSIIASVAYTQKTQAENYAIRDGSMVPPAVAAAYDGTSMATPHVAGMAALLRQARPSWSPSAIKSALMTTATGVKLADGSPDTNVDGFGAGHANPNGAVDPGLVYPAFHGDYMRFLCAEGWYDSTGAECSGLNVTSLPDPNLPSIAATFAGSRTVHRKVRNVGGASATYTATAVLPGFDVIVSPSSLSLGKGEVGEFTVKISRSTAPFNTPVAGALTWTDGVHVVRSPIQATAQELLAPAILLSPEASGALSFDVLYGFGGASSTATLGLAASQAIQGHTAYGTTDCNVSEFTVPANTSYVRTSYAAADVNLDTSEFYSWYTDASGGFYGFTHFEGSDFVLDMQNPAPGTYKLCMWPLASGTGYADYTAYLTQLNPANPAVGDLKVSGLPTSKVKVGKTYTATASWSGLSASQHYFGQLQYLHADGSLAGSTYLRVEPGASAVKPATPRSLPVAVRSPAQLKAQQKRAAAQAKQQQKAAANRAR